MQDEVRVTEWTTPKGNTARIAVRAKTNDAMVAESIIRHDEYKTGNLNLTGTALDIGAHIGAATVLLALDNPELKVIAVEPVPDNILMLTRNVADNGLTDRVSIIEGVAGPKRAVHYNFRGSEIADMHRYIGNQRMPTGTDHDTIEPAAFSLTQLVKMAGGHVSFCKIDVEGAEDEIFADPAVGKITLIHGEWHNGPAGTEIRLLAGEDLATEIPKPAPRKRRTRKAAAK